MGQISSKYELEEEKIGKTLPSSFDEVGEEITFIPTGISVKVASDDSIEYEGRIYKLSPFVGTFMPEEQRNVSGAYQGAKYFSYDGKVLDEIRKEKELQ